MRYNDRQRRAMFANMNNENKFSYSPTYVAGDMPLMAVDAAGTAGSAVVGAVPLVTGLGIAYIGADMVLKTKDKLTDQYKSEKAALKPKRYSQRLLEKDKTRIKKSRYSMRPLDDVV